MSIYEMADILVEEFGVSEETIQIITNINGWNETTMCDILFAVAGYNDFDQLED